MRLALSYFEGMLGNNMQSSCNLCTVLANFVDMYASPFTASSKVAASWEEDEISTRINALLKKSQEQAELQITVFTQKLKSGLDIHRTTIVTPARHPRFKEFMKMVTDGNVNEAHSQKLLALCNSDDSVVIIEAFNLTDTLMKTVK